jgi:hypothetical protein
LRAAPSALLLGILAAWLWRQAAPELDAMVHNYSRRLMMRRLIAVAGVMLAGALSVHSVRALTAAPIAANDPLPYVMSIESHTVAASTAARMEERALFANLDSLVVAQNAHFAIAGRYTARVQDLPTYRGYSRATIYVTAGATWLTIQAKGVDGADLTIVSWRTDGLRTESGNFGSR